MEKIHPFEKSGLGIGPFTFVTVISHPSPGSAEHNPAAYTVFEQFEGEGAR